MEQPSWKGRHCQLTILVWSVDFDSLFFIFGSPMSSTFLILYHYPYPLLLMLLFVLFFIFFLWFLLEMVYEIEQSGR